MPNVIPFSDPRSVGPSDAPLVFAGREQGAMRYEVSSGRWLRELLSRGVRLKDVQYDCAGAQARDIAWAVACGVKRFVIDDSTEFRLLPARTRVIVRMAASDRLVWRAVLAGFEVEGVAVPRADVLRCAELCSRLAFDGIVLRVVQVTSPISPAEQRAVTAMSHHDPDIWVPVGRVDDGQRAEATPDRSSSSERTASTVASGEIPNRSSTSEPGALAPNRSMETDLSTHFDQPMAMPASTETLGSSGGSTSCL